MSGCNTEVVAKRKRGFQCVAYGCCKRWYNRKKARSDSEGSDDDESHLKRLYPRTFHRQVF